MQALHTDLLSHEERIKKASHALVEASIWCIFDVWHGDGTVTSEHKQRLDSAKDDAIHSLFMPWPDLTSMEALVLRERCLNFVGRLKRKIKSIFSTLALYPPQEWPSFSHWVTSDVYRLFDRMTKLSSAFGQLALFVKNQYLIDMPYPMCMPTFLVRDGDVDLGMPTDITDSITEHLVAKACALEHRSKASMFADIVSWNSVSKASPFTDAQWVRMISHVADSEYGVGLACSRVALPLLGMPAQHVFYSMLRFNFTASDQQRVDLHRAIYLDDVDLFLSIARENPCLLMLPVTVLSFNRRTIGVRTHLDQLSIHPRMKKLVRFHGDGCLFRTCPPGFNVLIEHMGADRIREALQLDKPVVEDEDTSSDGNEEESGDEFQEMSEEESSEE